MDRFTDKAIADAIRNANLAAGMMRPILEAERVVRLVEPYEHARKLAEMLTPSVAAAEAALLGSHDPQALIAAERTASVFEREKVLMGDSVVHAIAMHEQMIAAAGLRDDWGCSLAEKMILGHGGAIDRAFEHAEALAARRVIGLESTFVRLLEERIGSLFDFHSYVGRLTAASLGGLVLDEQLERTLGLVPSSFSILHRDSLTGESWDRVWTSYLDAFAEVKIRVSDDKDLEDDEETEQVVQETVEAGNALSEAIDEITLHPERHAELTPVIEQQTLALLDNTKALRESQASNEARWNQDQKTKSRVRILSFFKMALTAAGVAATLAKCVEPYVHPPAMRASLSGDLHAAADGRAIRYVSTTELMVRSGPGTTFDAVGLLAPGAALQVTQVEGDWMAGNFQRADGSSSVGWSHRDHLVLAPQQ